MNMKNKRKYENIFQVDFQALVIQISNPKWSKGGSNFTFIAKFKSSTTLHFE